MTACGDNPETVVEKWNGNQGIDLSPERRDTEIQLAARNPVCKGLRRILDQPHVDPVVELVEVGDGLAEHDRNHGGGGSHDDPAAFLGGKGDEVVDRLGEIGNQPIGHREERRARFL